MNRFLFPTINPIVGTLDYESITDIHIKLNYNAVSVQFNIRCGTLGLLFLTVSPAIYATLSTICLFCQLTLDPNRAFLLERPALSSPNLRYCFTEATKIFTEYENTDKALCQILLAYTDELYVQSLCHKYIGYGKTTTRALLEHLYYSYANISASALQDNDKRLQTPYDSNQPFETMTNQVENAVDYASAGDTPYTPTQVVRISFQILFQTDLFIDN